ncbi:MAG TPA: sulfotransferase [Rhizomicrobium sp.]|jgi:hypothetical protein
MSLHDGADVGKEAQEGRIRADKRIPKIENAQNFCFVIGRPRSGTTVFKSMLQTHPSVFAVGEIFNESNPRSYFHFQQTLLHDDPCAAFPSRGIGNFLKYLENCRSLACKLRPEVNVVVLDIKYDQAHLLCEPWWSIAALPRVFSLLRELGCRIIDVHRSDLVGLVISNQIAIQTKIYHSNKLGRGEVQDAKIRIDPQRLLKEVTATSKAYERIHRHFRDYKRYLMVTYEQMFDREQFSASLLDRVASFLGVAGEFDPVPRLAKLLSDDTYAYVENAAELRAFLKDADDSGTLPVPFQG